MRERGGGGGRVTHEGWGEGGRVTHEGWGRGEGDT